MDLASRFSDAFSTNGNGHHHGERNATVDAATGVDSGCNPAAGVAHVGETSAASDSAEPHRRAACATERQAEGAKSPWHDARGRFVKGNPGGPGNPYNRQVAAAKREAADFMTPERVQEFCTILFERVRHGDMAAARILRDVAMPKGIDPDTVHLHEWQLMQEEAKMIGPAGSPWGELRQLQQTPDPEVILEFLRLARLAQTATFARYLKGGDAMGAENRQEVRATNPAEGVAIMVRSAATRRRVSNGSRSRSAEPNAVNGKTACFRVV